MSICVLIPYTYVHVCVYVCVEQSMNHISLNKRDRPRCYAMLHMFVHVACEHVYGGCACE